MIDDLLYFDSFLTEVLLSIELKCKFIKRIDREELKSTVGGFIDTIIEKYRIMWNEKRELEDENDKLIKILFFMNVYPTEWINIDQETIELALQNDDQVSGNTFDHLRSIQSNYQWFSFIMERPPKDIKELKEFMKKDGQAPKYEEVKDKLSNILKTI